MILAIETSLRSASISVYNNNRELGFYIFGEDEPISQNLVPGIKTLFKDVGISSQEITSVAVSNGPGSLTGIRVGISVGLGLAYSWGVNCLGIALTEAMRSIIKEDTVMAIVAAGKTQCYFHYFSSQNNQLFLVNNEDVAEKLSNYGEGNVVVIKGIEQLIQNTESIRLVIFSENPSKLIAKNAQLLIENEIENPPNPIYLQANTFKKAV